ncbi:MAG: lantibiotic immunity ABC transporter MutE/EpiE family permease subunit [Clostridiales Family XIII bacterium]|jgi:ABC-2 type transport system permease protein|nr:lantibiotic immunity ABC transporter MutE/EpiE family permease subunit [Clostridiales Family XIII bacterium]
MINLLQSEITKGKGMFSRVAPILIPAVAALLSLFLMSGSFAQINTYNWWYTCLAPVAIALLCSNLIGPDRRLHWQNIDVLPQKRGSTWDAKVILGILILTISNFFLFIITTIAGVVFGQMYSISVGITCLIIMVISFAWMIPFGMFLYSRFNSATCFIVLLLINVIGSIQPVAGGKFWFLPMAIPARLMSAMIGINPNGVLLEPNSPLYDTSVILPGLVISIVTFAIAYLSTRVWFSKKGA